MAVQGQAACLGRRRINSCSVVVGCRRRVLAATQMLAIAIASTAVQMHSVAIAVVGQIRRLQIDSYFTKF